MNIPNIPAAAEREFREWLVATGYAKAPAEHIPIAAKAAEIFRRHLSLSYPFAPGKISEAERAVAKREFAESTDQPAQSERTAHKAGVMTLDELERDRDSLSERLELYKRRVSNLTGGWLTDKEIILADDDSPVGLGRDQLESSQDEVERLKYLLSRWNSVPTKYDTRKLKEETLLALKPDSEEPAQ